MRIGFLASHGASSARAIWDAARAGEIAVEPCVLVCNNSGADALAWARSVGLKTRHLSSKTHLDPDELDAAIAETLDEASVDLVVLSGYMKKLGSRTLRRFHNRILNIHPALLPAFGGSGMYGIRVHEAVIGAGATTTGISVHVVDADYDAGPVLYQSRVAVRHGETPQQLQQRVAGHEPNAYLRTLELILTGKIDLDDVHEDWHEPVVEDVVEAEYADLAAFRRSLPAKRMGAGLLVRDTEGRVMLVEPTYKEAWEIPGGVVDEDESPRECVIREVDEEFGLAVEPGRLLVVDYQHPEPERTESMMFVFDGGVIDDETTSRIVLREAELRSWRFVDRESLEQTASVRLARRLLHALDAVHTDETRYLENGQLRSGGEKRGASWADRDAPESSEGMTSASLRDPTDPRAPAGYAAKALEAAAAAEPRLTRRGQKVMRLAQEQARADDDDHVGTEHVLLGILHEGGAAARTLRTAGITHEVFVAQLYEEPGSSPDGVIPLTPRAQMIVGLAAKVVDKRGHRGIEPEHLLVAVIEESDLWQAQGKTGPFHLLKAAEAVGCDWNHLRHAADTTL